MELEPYYAPENDGKGRLQQPQQPPEESTPISFPEPPEKQAYGLEEEMTIEATSGPTPEDIAAMQHETATLAGRFKEAYMKERLSFRQQPFLGHDNAAELEETGISPQELLYGESMSAISNLTKDLTTDQDIGRFVPDKPATYLFREVALQTGREHPQLAASADFMVIQDKQTGMYAAFDITDEVYNPEVATAGVACHFGSTREEALEQARTYLEQQLKVKAYDSKPIRQLANGFRNLRDKGLLPQYVLNLMEYKGVDAMYAALSSPHASELAQILPKLANQGILITSEELSRQIEMGDLNVVDALLVLAQEKLGADKSD